MCCRMAGTGISAPRKTQLRQKQQQQRQKLDDTPYDAERKDLKAGVDGPFTLSDSLVSTSTSSLHAAYMCCFGKCLVCIEFR